MVFLILPLASTPSYLDKNETHSDDGDIHLPDAPDHSSRLAKLSTVIVTPGETVTEDPQWMRHVFFLTPLFIFCPPFPTSCDLF